MVNDPHAVLGVSPGASQDEIKRAYRRKAKECHPDLHPGDPNAARKMNELNEAYDMLMNPEKYAKRQQQQNPYGGNPYGQSSYGGNPYGGNPYSGAYQQRQQTYGGNPYGQSQGGYQQRGGQGYGGWQSDFGGFGFEDLFGFGGFQSTPTPPPTEQPGDSPLVRQAIQAIAQRQFQQAAIHLQNVPSTQRNARWYYLSGVANHGAGNTIQATEHMTRACQMDPNNGLYQTLLRQYRQSGQTYTQNGQGHSRTVFDPSQLCMWCCLMNMCCPYSGFMCC